MAELLRKLSDEEKEKFLEILNYGECSDEEFNLRVQNDRELNDLLEIASKSSIVTRKLYRHLSVR